MTAPKHITAFSPKVSLIFPVYNQTDLLLRALTTLREVTRYSNYEVILVDDSSTEDMSVIYTHKGLYDQLIILPRHSGNSTVAVNEGIKRASGTFIQYQNTDVYFEMPDWLEKLVETFDEETAVVGPALLYPDRTIQCAGMFFDRKGLNHNLYNHKLYDALEKRTLEVPMVTGCGLTTRKNLLEKFGGFRVYQPYGWDDTDWCLRVWREGYKTRLCLNSYFYHLGTVSYTRMDSPQYHAIRRKIRSEFKSTLKQVAHFRLEGPKYIFFLKDLNFSKTNERVLDLIRSHKLNEKGEILIVSSNSGEMKTHFQNCGARLLPSFLKNTFGFRGKCFRLPWNVWKLFRFIQTEKPTCIIYERQMGRFFPALKLLSRRRGGSVKLLSIDQGDGCLSESFSERTRAAGA